MPATQNAVFPRRKLRWPNASTRSGFTRLARSSIGAGSLLLSTIAGSMATEPCTPVVGRLASAEGLVEVQRGSAASWSPANLNAALCQGDTVRTGERSRATLALLNQAVLRLDQNSAVQLSNVVAEQDKRSILELLRGALQSFSRKPRRMLINTPYLNGSIEGTEFVFRAENDRSTLTVFEGTVVASNAQGQVSVGGGESVAADAGKAPLPLTVVRPRDAAQWSLYYPPILAAPGLAGDVPGSAEAYLYQGAQNLSTGRVDEARSDIQQALALDPKMGSALALRAVIEVVQNHKTEAMMDARQAVALSPDKTATWIALSYAQQADFQIPQARDSLLEAVKAQPQDALAWARLAELHLMLGERERSAAAAAKAAALAPDLERAQLAVGFGALAEFRSADARQAFEKAISLDSADPLARLGLGLALISSGELEEGRRDLEIAVALDSNSALLRAYLGKAYFEEKRTSLDAQQFAIAKKLDPLDPTAFLYDGIREQTENRPVEALQDLEESQALNDNRATYRGRLLLDKDRAARGVSLARAYNDLGFTQLGTNEAAQSLALDPSNASAHRFLSDSYRDSSRQEISRVSELLQAQLLQDINIAPIQPSLGETNIATHGGPASVGFNEFTPLFQRNLTEVDASAMAGTNATRSGELAVSGVHGPWSLSAGAFTYRSDGFRPNNDQMHNVYNLFAQVAASPVVNLQAEFRRRNTRSGDILAQFDLASFQSNFRRSFDEDSTRVGVRIAPSPRSTFLLSAISSDRTEDISVLDDVTYAPFTYGFASRTEEKANQAEGQYLFQETEFNLIAGISSARVAPRGAANFVYYLTADPSVFFPFPPMEVSQTVEDMRGYAYGHLRTDGGATWTLGLSYGDYRADAYQLSVHRINPKASVEWDLSAALRLRAAAFRGVKPSLATNRTLEPTEIAGFNQYFDDVNGTKSEGYGTGLDWRVNKDAAVGFDLTGRKLEEPVIFNGVAQFEDRYERRHSIYAYWTPAPRWSLRAQAVYDRYQSDEASLDPERPRDLKTVTLPLQLRYFHPDGWFGGVDVTLVDQHLRRADSATLAQGSEQFVVTDLVAGYRLPRRIGIASVGVFNLFDRKFWFQGDAYRATQDEAKGSLYVPQRTVMGRISLSF